MKVFKFLPENLEPLSGRSPFLSTESLLSVSLHSYPSSSPPICFPLPASILTSVPDESQTFLTHGGFQNQKEGSSLANPALPPLTRHLHSESSWAALGMDRFLLLFWTKPSPHLNVACLFPFLGWDTRSRTLLLEVGAMDQRRAHLWKLARDAVSWHAGPHPAVLTSRIRTGESAQWDMQWDAH